jgi:protein O-mannosyl-transferase
MGNDKNSYGGKVLTYALVLAVVSLLQYAYSLRNDFVWDAATVFRDDPSIREFKYLPQYFSEEMFRHIPIDQRTTERLKYYRPLTKTLHLLEYQVFGPRPTGYNAVNIVLNALVAVLGFLLVHAITGNSLAAFLAALLYAVNPMRVEAVSWAYSDAYILTALFSLLSLLLYHKKSYIPSYIVFALSLFCHESAILLVAIIVLYEYFIREEDGARRLVRAAPFFALAGAFLLVRRAIVGPIPLTDVGFIPLCNTVAVVMKRSVKIFFLPDAPITIYPSEVFLRLSREVVVSYMAVTGLVLFGVFLWFKKREYLFWYLWFFVWISVTFNIGRLSDYLMAEKVLYLASFGFCTLIALFIIDAGKYRRAAIAAVCCLIIVHAGITFSRTRYWKNDAAYFSKAVEFAPRFYPATYALAGLAVSNGRYDQAIALYEGTIESAPFFSLAPYSLAGLYASMGRYDEAIALYERTVEINPRFGDAYCNLGNVYFLTGNDGKAVSVWKKAVQKDPANPMPYYNIGMVMEKDGALEQALAYYRLYIALAPKPDPALFDRIRKLEERTKTVR